MISDILQNHIFFRSLHLIDQELCQACRQKGCPYCHGRLHHASYLRKPRGGPPKIDESCEVRLSLCCGREGCRRRVLPPSCLFMGRKVYWKAVILLAGCLNQRRFGGMSLNRLSRMLGIPRRTITRWMQYLRTEFVLSRQWQQLRGYTSSRSSCQSFPGALLEAFLDHHSCSEQALIRCLRFLA